MSQALYTTSATSTGGGRDGRVATDDKKLDVKVAPPAELGGNGDGTNPEQLVAAGWASCFNGALQLTLRNAGVKVEQTPEVNVSMTLNKVEEGFRLAAHIKATVFGVSPEEAESLVASAHAFCPYSKAMRGDIDVTVEGLAG